MLTQPFCLPTYLPACLQGNKFAFASGKQARQEERQLAQQFKSNLKLSTQAVVSAGSATLKVDDKYAFMAKVREEGTLSMLYFVPVSALTGWLSLYTTVTSLAVSA